MSKLPFSLEFRLLDRRTMMVTASRGDVVVTERYRVGHSAGRQQVSERLLADGRLYESQLPDVQFVIDELARAERDAVLQLDAMDVDCTITPPSKRDEKSSNVSLATQLVNLVISTGIELWQEPGGKAWATIPRGDSWANVPIGSDAFRKWVIRIIVQKDAKVPGANAIQDALQALSGMAENEGQVHCTHVRVAACDDLLYLDLGDRDGNVLEIAAHSSKLVQRPPVKFRRPPAMQALPTPRGGGSLDDLRKYLNVASEKDFILVIAWLVFALSPNGPYPVLQLRGEQGSAKSTTARILRSLIDPNQAMLRSPPRSEQDMLVAANNSWIIALDNLSILPAWLSDALCRLSTGGGFSTRKLYSDDGEVVFNAKRPILLTGIEEFATRSDLLDRMIDVVLAPVPEAQRRDEATFWSGFHEDRPAILGALVDAVSCALRRLKEVRLSSPPRMADFVRWVVAAEPALPWPPGRFLEAYSRNRQDVHETALNASPIGPAVLALFTTTACWEGTPSELLRALTLYANLECNRYALPQGWPRSPQALSNILSVLAPNLRALGVHMSRPRRSADKRRLRLEYVGTPSSRSSLSSLSSSNPVIQPEAEGSPSSLIDAQTCYIVHPDAASLEVAGGPEV